MIVMVILTPIAVLGLLMALARLEATLLPREQDAAGSRPHAPPHRTGQHRAIGLLSGDRGPPVAPQGQALDTSPDLLPTTADLRRGNAPQERGGRW